MEQNKKDKDRGYLYPNQNKNKPTQPDFTGSIVINGESFRLAGWEAKSSEGKKYISLAISQVQEGGEGGGHKPAIVAGTKNDQENSANNSKSNRNEDEEDISKILNDDFFNN